MAIAYTYVCYTLSIMNSYRNYNNGTLRLIDINNLYDICNL